MPRQARAGVTREAILLAAALEFDEHGFDGARIDRIATVQGISKGALYFHFKSKEALARALVDAKYANWPVIIADATSTGRTGFAAAREICRQVGRVLTEDVRARAAMTLSQTVPELAPVQDPYAQWIDVVAVFLSQDETSQIPAQDAKELATVAVEAFFGSYMIAKERGRLSGLESSVDRLWRILGDANRGRDSGPTPVEG